MNKYLLLLASFICNLIGFCQANKDLKIDYMLRGCVYAQSSIIDSQALGGYASSRNAPKKINDSVRFLENGFFMKIDTSYIGIFAQEYNGYTLFMVNKSDTLVELRASDSRLNVIAEVYYQNKWQPIEYLPRSGCGNSYHSVYLKQDEYWSFDIPKFAGKIKVQLRYSLALGGDRFIYSNVIDAQINPGQLSKPQGHKPRGIMDPYND